MRKSKYKFKLSVAEGIIHWYDYNSVKNLTDLTIGQDQLKKEIDERLIVDSMLRDSLKVITKLQKERDDCEAVSRHRLRVVDSYRLSVETLTKKLDDMDQARADSELKNISLTWRVDALKSHNAILKRLLADSNGETL